MTLYCAVPVGAIQGVALLNPNAPTSTTKQFTITSTKSNQSKTRSHEVLSLGSDPPHLACGVRNAQAAQSHRLVLVVGSCPCMGAARPHNPAWNIRGVCTAKGRESGLVHLIGRNSHNQQPQRIQQFSNIRDFKNLPIWIFDAF